MEDGIELTAVLTNLPQCWFWVSAEPVGARYFHLHRQRPADSHTLDKLISEHVRTPGGDTSDQDREQDQENDSDSAQLCLDDNAGYVRSLDPKQWLKQDHYRVLGLSTLRYRATDQQIRQAYRVMVLRHHPDKRAASSTNNSDAAVKSRRRSKTTPATGKISSGNEEDDDYFTCITRAYETLSDRARRISYDSIDPTFDDSIPSERVPADAFYRTFAPVFARNAHWSVSGRMPTLGDDTTSREHVERFYTKWFGMESWREFTYDDQEGSAQERGENRDERRYMEKQIRAVRKERKRAECARIRQLVELAHSSDPRVQRFRQDDRQRKLEQKRRRADERQKRIDAEQAAQRLAEKQSLERREAEDRVQREREAEQRRERDAQRQRLAAGRQRVRRLCEQDDYYADGESERADHMMQLERLCVMMDAQQLEELADQLHDKRESRSQQRDVYRQRVSLMQQALLTESNGCVGGEAGGSGSTTSNSNHSQRSAEWSHDELQALIRAVRLFPAGTVRRWEVVANFIGQHSDSQHTRSAKEVLDQAKRLQHSDQQLRSVASERPLVSKSLGVGGGTPAAATSNDTSQFNAAISQRTETPMEQQGSNSSTWSGEEQRLLEQALKTYGAQTPARWDRIAECLPNRTKKDCMRRYKELVEIVKAKKAAQAAVNSSK